jgi:GNAT superfamily N-acetyltransferase
MQVRPARVEDAAAIAEVHVRTWQEAYAGVFAPARLAELDVGRRRDAWERWLAEPSPGWAVAVAEDDGRVVAFAWVGESREVAGEGELYALYALPEAWGSGAGRALLEAGLASLREDGRLAATLWVLADNPRARRFYEREGWTADGGSREEEHLGARVVEVRYRIAL